MKKTITFLTLLVASWISATAQSYNPAPYCPFGVYGPIDVDDFTYFELGPYFKTMTPSDSSYLYCTDETETIYQTGHSYPIKLVCNKTDIEYMIMSVYIDYNHNNQFDPGELAFNYVNLNDGIDSVSGSVTIPDSALTGWTRLRIVMMDTTDTGSSVAADPCAWSDVLNGDMYPLYGEAIDFNVNIISSSTGIQEVNNSLTEKIYPNPAINKVYLPEDLAGTPATIIDMLGKTVMELQATDNNGIDISSLKPGIYIVQICKNGQISNQRLCVSR